MALGSSTWGALQWLAILALSIVPPTSSFQHCRGDKEEEESVMQAKVPREKIASREMASAPLKLMPRRSAPAPCSHRLVSSRILPAGALPGGTKVLGQVTAFVQAGATHVYNRQPRTCHPTTRLQPPMSRRLVTNLSSVRVKHRPGSPWPNPAARFRLFKIYTISTYGASGNSLLNGSC